MSGVLCALLGSVSQVAATIPAGSSASGTTGGHAFGTLSVTTVGGSGSFTYQWYESDDTVGTWTAPGTSATQTVTVGATPLHESTGANYYSVVTDTVTGFSATTNTATFTWTRA